MAGGGSAYRGKRPPHAPACLSYRACGNVAKMAGRPKSVRRSHAASGRQLWRLNQLGWVRLEKDAAPVSSAEARAVIEAELQSLGSDRFPDTRGAAMSQEV
jgi:hypothetical protein